MSHERQMLFKMKALKLVEKLTADVVIGGTSNTSNVKLVIDKALADFAQKYKISESKSSKSKSDRKI